MYVHLKDLNDTFSFIKHYPGMSFTHPDLNPAGSH